MGTLTCTFKNITQTTADLDGYFTGGDSAYSRHRYLDLYINNVYKTRITSTDEGGAESDFAYTLTGLSAGTTYNWSVTLLYIADGEYIKTSYTASGRFTTSSPPPTYDIGATLHYDANGGTGAPADSVSRNQSSTVSSDTVSFSISQTRPQRTGYTFKCWKYGNTTYDPGDSLRVTRNTSKPTYTLVAQWDSNGGVYIYATKTVNGVATTSWWPAQPYIYANNQWNPATAYIYANGHWNPL